VVDDLPVEQFFEGQAKSGRASAFLSQVAH
jgi:hypothetical protein